jgi:AraC family transcriptional regulator of adaptative response / DNA-3-methyladenine glycosylase II
MLDLDRCRHAVEGWDRRNDRVGRAMRLIADGVVDRDGVSGLARRLGCTERDLQAELSSVAGAGPLALARNQRAQTARLLLEATSIPIADVALGAGFRSARELNVTAREIFALAPRELRARARRGERIEDRGEIALRLPYRAPLDANAMIEYLGVRAVPGVEEVVDGAYRRSLRLPHGTGTVELHPGDGCIRARFRLEDLRDLGTAIQRSRALLDLDADPDAVSEALASDPLLGWFVRAAPGRRVAGHVDAHELAFRAVLGQQVSVRGAATLTARLVEAYGSPLDHPLGTVTCLFPSAEQVAAMRPGSLGMPRARHGALIGLAAALADGRLALDPGADRDEARQMLLALPGIGPWTTAYVVMRALRDPDAFMPSDLGVRRALERLGHDDRPPAAERLADRWRPYRAYALQHLWASLATEPPAKRTPESARCR